MDFETFLKRWAGDDFDKKGTVKITVLNENPDDSWTPNEFRKLLDEIPEEHQDTTCVFLEDEGFGDTPHVRLKIQYNRPETDTEHRSRVEKVRENARQIFDQSLKKDRKEYERLKKIFEE